jgi:hypothetical protein
MKVTLGQIYTYLDNKKYTVYNFDNTATGKYVILKTESALFAGHLRYPLLDFEEDIKCGYWILDVRYEKSRKFKKELKRL